MIKSACLIDGFNLYHSLKDAEYRLAAKDKNLRWLDIASLCNALPQDINDGKKRCIDQIYYFSAYAYHLNDSDITNRHKKYVRALESVGININMKRFKKKKYKCKTCFSKNVNHEEKETDVAIGMKLIELLVKKECQDIFLVTGDTDLIPAIETAKDLFPDNNIIVVMPFNRHNKNLKNSAYKSINLSVEKYLKHQFPEEISFKKKIISKPEKWREGHNLSKKEDREKGNNDLLCSECKMKLKKRKKLQL